MGRQVQAYCRPWAGEDMWRTTQPDLVEEPLAQRAFAGKLLPGRQLRLFRNQDWPFAQRVVRRGTTILPLVRAAEQLSDVTIPGPGQGYDLVDYVARNRVAGLLILQRGQILCEHYEFGNAVDTPWISNSIAKSVATTLVGAAIHDGFISSVDQQLTHYLPQLANTSYEGVCIRDLMTMTTGLRWEENYADPLSERRRMLELQVAQRPGIVVDYLARRPRVARPGTRWLYATGDAHLLGPLLHAATGTWVADYLSEKIWSRAGMEHEASWWLDSPGGLEMCGSGLTATMRDYARFGLFMLNGAVINGRSILPDGWIPEATRSRRIGDEQVDYGYMWWPVAGSSGSFAEGAFSARGIFGQYIYINPARDLVIVTLSLRAKARLSEAIPDNDFFNAVSDSLR